MKQIDFLSDEFMEHIPGPSTGQSEYLRLERAKLVQRMQASVADWRLPELPSLQAFDHVIIDLETTGLRWYASDKMVGAALWLPDGSTRYLPIRHKVGPNIPEAQFFEWVKRELRGKRVVNIRTKFDLHMFRADGVDLESQGCTFGDVAHYAALLDDHRRLFNQEDLAREFLGAEVGKVTAAHGFQLDAGKFAEYPAGLVAARAEHDVLTVSQLLRVMWPQLTEQSLHRVREVEDKIIPVVVEMEHNGAPIDQEMLQRFCEGSEKDLEDLLWKISHETGCRLETFHKRDDILRLLETIKVPIPLDPETDKPTIADAALAEIDHPTITDLRTGMALESLRSKFLLPYQRSTSRDGILRYELHQLPYQDEEEGGGGAVSGRFSSAAMTYYDEKGTQKKEGANAQQVVGVKSQNNPKETFNPTKAYIVRRLFRPASREAAWFCSDMRQIEYRRFVHFSNSPSLIQSYTDDPNIDYHALVHGLILKHTGKDFERTHVKNLNFASLYGAGLIKIAFMVGEINERTYLEMKSIQERQGYKVAHADPRVAKTRALYEVYHEMFPEVKRLLGTASFLAMPACNAKRCDHSKPWVRRLNLKHRGYVMTILGRRARFQEGDRFYSALNRAIQGTAADDHKVALIDVHNARHSLGLIPRMTVHDEFSGDLLEPGRFEEVARFMNLPRLDSRVPILWDSHCGPSWAEAK